MKSGMGCICLLGTNCRRKFMVGFAHGLDAWADVLENRHVVRKHISVKNRQKTML